jgi:hypothetical protein
MFHYCEKRTFLFYNVVHRKAREGWPLLTVENKANVVPGSTHDRGPSLGGSL